MSEHVCAPAYCMRNGGNALDLCPRQRRLDAALSRISTPIAADQWSLGGEMHSEYRYHWNKDRC